MGKGKLKVLKDFSLSACRMIMAQNQKRKIRNKSKFVWGEWVEDEFRDVHIEFEELLGYMDRPIYFLAFEYADLKLNREIKGKKIDDGSSEAMGGKRCGEVVEWEEEAAKNFHLKMPIIVDSKSENRRTLKRYSQDAEKEH